MNNHTVCIGIPVREHPEWTTQTLAQLRACTPAINILLFADGLDARSRTAIEALGERVIGWDRVLGNAACFNRLLQDAPADLYVLLENGAQVAPRWLEHLERALAAKATHGIAGPSTNLTWNEQQAFPALQSDAASLAQAALDAEVRFGTACTPLTPLHSLGDFCYAVSHQVVQAIGAADESYADGPCWEMDYNIRAARAGFAGVWVKAAVVWRRAQTDWRRANEARRFLLNKRRYQEKFCGLHLRSQTRSYDAHCTGEACPHFAPRELVVTHQEFPGGPRVDASAAIATPRDPPPAEPRPTSEIPRVSCIMPTANRRPFVPQAIAAFLAQDYENRELIIIDDGTDSVEDLVPNDARIHYVRGVRGLSLGAKRNEACRLAQGEIIMHWDDDDWHAGWRLSYQVGALLAEQADICGLDRMWFYDAENQRAWQYVYQGRPRWLAGGSFCYRKTVWERRPFADISAGEDTRFVREAPFRKVFALARDDFYVARIHSRNTCRKQPGGSSWHSIPADKIRALIDAAVTGPAPDGVTLLHGREPPRSRAVKPLVTCIMPTRNRRAFLPIAMKYFRRQSYANRELIVIDDGQDEVRDLMPADAQVRYERVNRPISLGEKRNLACEMALGEIVVHWDDDDWYGPERLAAQVAPLLCGQADVSALSMPLALDLGDMRFWRCRAPHHARIHYRDLCPGTLAYWRRLWLGGARYAPIGCAEDVAFLKSLPSSVAVLRVPEEEHFVCVRHSSNTWPIVQDWHRSPSGWEPTPPPKFVTDEDMHAYVYLRAAFGHRQTAPQGASRPSTCDNPPAAA
jgi:glycosyltransferase involved in cell wall biosynthesis